MSWPLDYISRIARELTNSNLSSELFQYDPICYEQIRLAAQELAVESSIHQSCNLLDNVLGVSYANMSTAVRSTLFGWRRLYTEACILRSLADLGSSTAVESLSILDRAIIISGAAGDGRLDLILSIIEKIQLSYFPVRRFSNKSKSPTYVMENAFLAASKCEVCCLSVPPSLEAFSTKHSRRPFILRGYADDWPALHEHPWFSGEYLRFISGPGRLVPVEVGNDYRSDQWTQMLMNWDDFLSSLDLVDQPPPQASSGVLYLAQHSLFMQFPALRADIIIPDYAYAYVSPLEYTDYRPPANDDKLVLNAWVGPKGTISPAHTDPYYNLYVQVVGRKTVWLAEPALSKFMHPYSLSASAGSSYHPAADKATPSMNNTSQVDVFCVEETMYPQFWQHVVPHAMSVTLEPGDLLFIPPGWWHAMRSEETSFSVSMWF